MHKKRLNELNLYAVVQPDGPLLIKSGRESGADPTLPSMSFVRTRHPRTGEETIYIPGSSLKGAIRSHCERIIRTVLGEEPQVCCDPLGRNSCDKRLKNEARQANVKEFSTAEEYKRLCRACRTFGHTVHAGHFIAADAYPGEAINQLTLRQGVAINRFSGGAQPGALYELETAMAGEFQMHVGLVNFELWQVGLLALAMRDLADGRLLLGFGKSRGLGQVWVSFTHLEISYPGRFDAKDFTRRMYGMGALAEGSGREEFIRDYGLQHSQDVSDYGQPGRLEPGSADWGRPAVTFGFERPEIGWSVAQNADRGQAHHAVLDALKASVKRWAELRAEVSHA